MDAGFVSSALVVRFGNAQCCKLSLGNLIPVKTKSNLPNHFQEVVSKQNQSKITEPHSQVYM